MLIFSDMSILTLFYPSNDLSSALTRGTTVILSTNSYVHHRKTDLLLTSFSKFSIFLRNLYPKCNRAHLRSQLDICPKNITNSSRLKMQCCQIKCSLHLRCNNRVTYTDSKTHVRASCTCLETVMQFKCTCGKNVSNNA
jgi:hypothetical protein